MGKNERQILKSVIGDARACSDMSTGIVTMREREEVACILESVQEKFVQREVRYGDCRSR